MYASGTSQQCHLFVFAPFSSTQEARVCISKYVRDMAWLEPPCFSDRHPREQSTHEEKSADAAADAVEPSTKVMVLLSGCDVSSNKGLMSCSSFFNLLYRAKETPNPYTRSTPAA